MLYYCGRGSVYSYVLYIYSDMCAIDWLNKFCHPIRNILDYPVLNQFCQITIITYYQTLSVNKYIICYVYEILSRVE